MGCLGVLVAVALILIVLVDTFEVILLPRRIKHTIRLARYYYRGAWQLWRGAACRIPDGKWRQAFLSVFGPLSLFGLLTIWAVALITGFALLHWSLGTAIASGSAREITFANYLYFSGTTFFTLGYGDVVPTQALGRALSVLEAGLGFGFLALVISYLPVLYQAFSRREITISLLDARAGSPPTAGELLRRLPRPEGTAAIGAVLVEWERWAAEVLESHVSFPALRFYRSQHDNQSWVAALTTILDTTAILIAGVEGGSGYQARLTFAMARHTAVDLGLVSQTAPVQLETDRLPPAELARLREYLRESGIVLREGPAVDQSLTELRGLYEPFVQALALNLMFALPAFLPAKPPVDNWQTSPWLPRAPGLGNLSTPTEADGHFH